MFFLEHDAQPKTFKSVYDSLWWGIDKYLTATGGEDVNPITPAEKFLAGFIGILGVEMFALPAGIIASGFIEEIENNKLKKELIQLETKLIHAFSIEYFVPVMNKKKVLNLSHLSRKWLSLEDIKYKMGISESSLMQVCSFSKKLRLKNIKLNEINTVGLKFVNTNRTYGQCIKRNSKITIVNLYPFIQPYFGHFSMAISEILQANYISNKMYNPVSLLKENQLNMVNNNQYFETLNLHPALAEIKNDISSLKQDDGLIIFMVNAGSNEYLMQFNIGGDKSSNSFDNGLYFSDKDKLENYYNKAKSVTDKYEMLIGKHATVGKPDNNHVVNYIQSITKNNVLMLHVNVSILKKDAVEYYQYVSDFADIFKD
ncbi:hypothetical protein AW14_14615 [Siansivirga zeaxanthinifaciens CC-SAMT-1]|uniref:Uncharacterized protein n=2 Tax=Siansivirga TaxID=1204360 RepID=A0A0C5WFQ0_9FLAO|nr:hypothetical protein AW14_14615 [Siansivirga zeaxanthinifaciens CC-SAMT-1]